MVRKITLSLMVCALAAMVGTAIAAPGNSVKIKSGQIENFLPDNAGQKKFLELEFLGGLELTSKDDDFGGISGLRLLDENRFIAVTDQGKWLTGEIIREGDRPVAVENARMGRLRDKSGKKLKGKKKADSEGIEISGDSFLISFERTHRVERFKFTKDRLQATNKKPVFDLKDVDIDNNKGQEGIALVPQGNPSEGAILTFPELLFNSDGNLRVFMYQEGVREEFSIVPANAFSMTDAAFLPNGNLLLLERRFSFLTGMAARIRMFNGQDIKPGAVLAGSVVLLANSDYEIDNMEGLAVSEMADGSTRITLVSDDNFSGRQRTLLLEFRLPAKSQQ